MGLLDEVISIAGVGGGQQQAEHSTALTAILAYVNSPQVGGVAGLQKMFQQGGLGSVFSSWLGSGQNMPVSADQLQNVLHSGAFQEVAQKAGIDPAELTGMMSTLLPHLVDRLTPNGQMPDAGTLQGMLKGLTAGHQG
jgi:uncharacterized protein YidB (DUF937 family)